MMNPAARRSLIAAACAVSCVAAAFVAAQVYGRGVFFLVVAGGALLLAIWLFWHSTTSLTGDAPLSLEEALGLGAPTPEEERKQSVLRVLKDLEYEKAVGKIAEKDYQELSKKYRAEAKALLATLDDELGSARDRAERLFEERLREEQEKTNKLASRKASEDHAAIGATASPEEE